MKLAYKNLGTGRPLIILHGLFGSSDNWLTIAKKFAQHYHVFLLDARNHGLSLWSDEHSYALMAADLAEFITEHNLQNSAIIGHSMGGKTLMHFVQTSNITISKMVVVDISPRYYAPHHQREIAALQPIDLSKLQSRQDADDAMALIIPETMVRQFLLKGLYRNDAGDFNWRFNIKTIANHIDNIGEAQNKNTKVALEALFIRGANSSYYISESDQELIQDIFTNSKIVTIPNAAHWVQAEQPEIFYEVVMQFLAG